MCPEWMHYLKTVLVAGTSQVIKKVIKKANKQDIKQTTNVS